MWWPPGFGPPRPPSPPILHRKGVSYHPSVFKLDFPGMRLVNTTSWSCSNEAPQTVGLKTIDMYSLTVPEVSIQNQGVGRVGSLRGSEGQSVPGLS